MRRYAAYLRKSRADDPGEPMEATLARRPCLHTIGWESYYRKDEGPVRNPVGRGP